MTTKVLIVEDDPDLRRGLGRRIRSLGYEVVEAADDESAVTKARETAPDLVLFDGRDGVALLERYAQRRTARPRHSYDEPASLWFG
jgi:DNA-binding response OmpR family regulator